MRNFKKVIAVVAAATMTMAMSITAFADQTVTFHFQNSKNWEKVGGYIFQGISWGTNVTDNTFLVNPKADGTQKKLWPGALCTEDVNGWVKCTATFTDDVVKEGLVCKFNNFVADAAVNTTTEEDDVEFIKKSGIATTENATKEETEGIIINKKNPVLAAGTLPTDIYIEYDGKVATATVNEAPASYTAASSSASSSTDASASTGSTGTASTGTTGTASAGSTGSASTGSGSTGSGSTGTASTGTAKTAGTGTASSTNAPKTGDTVAVSTIALAIAAAAVVVASKKKVNA